MVIDSKNMFLEQHIFFNVREKPRHNNFRVNHQGYYSAISFAKKSINFLINSLGNCDTLGRLDLRDVIREATAVGVQCYATSRMLYGAENLLHSGQHYAKKVTRQVAYAKIEHCSLMSSEGIVERIAKGFTDYFDAFQTLPKRQIAFAKNMNEFFEMPFGRLLIENSIKTPYRYQNPIYRLTKDIADSNMKKGFFYYLDRLHCDHIEFFNARYQVIGVYNLDGTFNAIKFRSAQASGRNLKKLMKGK